jgi:hypothetical protein
VRISQFFPRKNVEEYYLNGNEVRAEVVGNYRAQTKHEQHQANAGVWGKL